MYRNILSHQGTLKLIRTIALLLIAFCLLPMHANAAPPSWQGVWDGTIGKSKVTVCLAANGKSAYVYQRYQVDIPLSRHVEEWEESVNGVVSGIWRLSEVQGDSLEGDWQNPKSQHTFPIHLKKIVGADGSTPCESSAYKSELNGVASDVAQAGTVSNANVGNAKRPEYVYVANQSDNTISAYHINPITGALAQVTGSPFETEGPPTSVTVNPAGTLVYVVLRNQRKFDRNGGPASSTISTYRINATTGVLSQIVCSPVKTGVSSRTATINPSGTFIYLTNTSANSVSTFRINATTGVLTQVRGSPLVAGFHPLSVTVNSSGTIAYVTYSGTDHDSNTSGILVYRINATTGALTPVPGTSLKTKGTPESVTVNPAGTFVYVTYCGFGYNDTHNTNGVLAYQINATTGALTAVPGNSFKTKGSPVSFTFNSAGTFAFLVNTDGVTTYRINAATGVLIPVAGSTVETGGQSESIVINHTYSFAYLLSDNGMGNGIISAFRINAATGVLTPLNGNPFKTLDSPEYITVNPAGTFVYVTNSGPNHIAAHQPNPNADTGDISI